MEDLTHKKLSTPYKVQSISNTIKDVDLGKRTVTGLFNASLYIDSDMDMLLPGAASKSIQERGVNSTKGNKIKHLKDHNWEKNIAKLEVLDEREVTVNGKKIQGIYHESFYPEATDSNDQLIKIQAGLYDARSIGFQYVQLEYVQEGEDSFEKYLAMALNPEVGEANGFFYVVKEIKLWEGSDVAFGANELTPLLGVKGATKDLLQKQLFDKLDICKGLMKSGAMTDEGFHRLEMEIFQIKSYISVLTDHESSKTSTAYNPSRLSKSTSKKGKDFIRELLIGQMPTI